jgi:hypothetical protein
MIKGDKLIVKFDCQIEHAIFKQGEVYNISTIHDYVIEKHGYGLVIQSNIKDQFGEYGDVFPLSEIEVDAYFISYNDWLAKERESQIKTILDD